MDSNCPQYHNFSNGMRVVTTHSSSELPDNEKHSTYDYSAGLSGEIIFAHYCKFLVVKIDTGELKTVFKDHLKIS